MYTFNGASLVHPLTFFDRDVLMVWGAFKQWQKNENKSSLYNVYKTFSEEKRHVMIRCRRMCDILGGRQLRIVYHNNHWFSVGFLYEDSNYNGPVFVYRMKGNSYFVPVSYLEELDRKEK